MLKISMLALCTVITSLLIKKQSPVTASVIGVSLCLIISINIINNISAITGQLGVMISLTGIGDVYKDNNEDYRNNLYNAAYI